VERTGRIRSYEMLHLINWLTATGFSKESLESFHHCCTPNKKVPQYFGNSLNVYKFSRRNKSEDLSLYKQNYENLKCGGNLKNVECENFET